MVEWSRARCIGKTELFFTETPEAEELAEAICLRCPLMVPCTEWSLKYRESYGVWGGLNYEGRCALALERGLVPPERGEHVDTG